MNSPKLSPSMFRACLIFWYVAELPSAAMSVRTPLTLSVRSASDFCVPATVVFAWLSVSDSSSNRLSDWPSVDDSDDSVPSIVPLSVAKLLNPAVRFGVTVPVSVVRARLSMPMPLPVAVLVASERLAAALLPELMNCDVSLWKASSWLCWVFTVLSSASICCQICLPMAVSRPMPALFIASLRSLDSVAAPSIGFCRALVMSSMLPCAVLKALSASPAALFTLTPMPDSCTDPLSNAPASDDENDWALPCTCVSSFCDCFAAFCADEI